MNTRDQKHRFWLNKFQSSIIRIKIRIHSYLRNQKCYSISFVFQIKKKFLPILEQQIVSCQSPKKIFKEKTILFSIFSYYICIPSIYFFPKNLPKKPQHSKPIYFILLKTILFNFFFKKTLPNRLYVTS